MPRIRRCPKCENRYRVKEHALNKAAQCLVCRVVLIDEVEVLDESDGAGESEIQRNSLSNNPQKMDQSQNQDVEDGEEQDDFILYKAALPLKSNALAFHADDDDPETKRKKAIVQALQTSPEPSEYYSLDTDSANRHHSNSTPWIIGGSLLGIIFVLRIILLMIRISNVPNPNRPRDYAENELPRPALPNPDVFPRIDIGDRPVQVPMPKIEPIKPVMPSLPIVPPGNNKRPIDPPAAAKDPFSLTNAARVKNRLGKAIVQVDYAYTGVANLLVGPFSLMVKTSKGTLRSPMPFLREKQGTLDTQSIESIQDNGEYEIWIESGGSATAQGVRVSNIATGQ